MRVLERVLAARGRTRRDVQVVICPYMNHADFDLVQRYREAGADQVVLMAFTSHEYLVPTLDRLAETMVVPARTL